MEEEVYLDEEDSILYDEVPFEESVDEPTVEEIFVEHEEGAPVEEIFVEHESEEVIYEDVPVEEVYLDEELDDAVSEGSVEEETDDSDGWAEYIEEEFGDSIDDSEDSKE